MDRRKLPLSALRAFEAAAQCNSLSQAGQQLGVTHGAISHQIRSLEERLGVQLFSRANNRLHLTPEGGRLYEAVHRGFNTILDGTRNLNPEQLSGELVIACTQTIATVWAARAICQFYEKYPSIQIIVQEIQPLQRHIPPDVDIAICYGEPAAEDREVLQFASPALHPVCSPTLMNERKSARSPDDIAQFPIIHDHTVPWSRWFERYCKADIQAERNIYFPNTSQAINVARMGFGVALANSFEAKHFIEQGELIRVFDDTPIAEEHAYYLLRNADEQKSLKVRVFEEWMAQSVQLSQFG